MTKVSSPKTFLKGSKPGQISSFVKNSVSKKLIPFLSTCIMLKTKLANALVDDRLAGEGTGKILGINDPILGWVIIGVFTIVWSAYYTATKDLGGQSEEDGLSL